MNYLCFIERLDRINERKCMNEDASTIYIGNNFGTLPAEDEEKLRHFGERRINLCLIQIN